MVTSSQDSDFLGFSDSHIETHQRIKSSPGANANVDPSTTVSKPIPSNNVGDAFSAKNAISSADATSLERSNSEEFSDQDVRFKIEFEKRNSLLDTISECSIEPSSSNDNENDHEDDADTEADSAQPINGTGSHEIQTTNVYTLSVNENSSNAVDNPISSLTYVSQPELIKDLSFNGKLNTESKIIGTNESSTINDSQPLPLKSTTIQNHCEELGKPLNTSDRSNLEMQLQFESSREQINERSPDLFSDEEEPDDDKNENIEHSTSVASISFDDKENQSDDCIEKIEKRISKSIQGLLSGILPPPDVTNIQHDAGNMLSLYKQNVTLMDFGGEYNKLDVNENKKIDWIPNELKKAEWPQIQRINAHGLHYNRTKYTDNIEIMYLKLIERNVGEETGSSFTYNVSTAKKRPIRKL